MRPPKASGLPVTFSTGVKGMPFSCRNFPVPPEEIISTLRLCSFAASSSRPLLSLTLISARLISTGPPFIAALLAFHDANDVFEYQGPVALVHLARRGVFVSLLEDKRLGMWHQSQHHSRRVSQRR